MRLFCMVLANFALLCSTLLAQSNPVPFVNQPLVPPSTAPGSPGFTLTVNGTGFVSGSVVNWNGSPRTTTFVSESQLKAAVAASDVASAGTATVTVASPGPGGGVSNPTVFPIAAARATLSFSSSSWPAGTNTGSGRIADLNGDGNADIIAPNETSNTVSVLLGNGDGTFQAPQNYAVGDGPNDVTVADFNGDGKPDLAVANLGGSANSVSILLGKGDGTFAAHVDYAAGNSPVVAAAGDVNRDGKIDLVVGDDSGLISVLLGNGDGTFQPYKNYAAGGIQIFTVALGDFNHDGILDVVTANVDVNSVSLLLGNGDGTFQPHIDFPVSNGAFGLAVADFNGDGNLDLAVSNYYSNVVSILLGQGDGTFQPQVEYATGINPFGITYADVNGDGKLDLAIATSTPFAELSLLLGNGDGTFQPYVGYDSLGGSQISVGDFNNDGLLDFSVPDSNGVATVIQDHGTVVGLSPSKLTFTTQLVGTVSPGQALMLTNSGATTITITRITLGTLNFGLADKCPRSLLAGKSCRILVYFTPTTQGNLTDTLSIFDTGGGSPQLVPLSGSATVLSVFPKSLDFGSVAVGKTSLPQRVTLTNHGSTKVTISKISVTGVDHQDFTEINACGTSLGAGTSCTIDVWFTPRAAGSRSATLSITDSGGASPQTVPLTGTGQ